MSWPKKQRAALAFALTVLPASFAEAAWFVKFDGVDGSDDNALVSDDIFVLGGGSRGTLRLIVGYDGPNDPPLTEGTVGFSVQSSDPRVIALTAGFAHIDLPGIPPATEEGAGAEPPAQRFERVFADGLGPDGIDALGGVVGNGVGLDPSVPGNANGPLPNSFVFAEIDIQALAPGTTTLSTGTPGSIPDLNHLIDPDTFGFGSVRIQVVPEPASLGLVGVGLAAMFTRRRRN